MDLKVLYPTASKANAGIRQKPHFSQGVVVIGRQINDSICWCTDTSCYCAVPIIDIAINQVVPAFTWIAVAAAVDC